MSDSRIDDGFNEAQDKRLFAKRIRALFSIEEDDLPDLMPSEREKAVAAPLKYFLRTNHETSMLIWRAVVARSSKP
ncbi:MAG: hypothetical protein WC829_14360 [Hyphomicrobium sp.]